MKLLPSLLFIVLFAACSKKNNTPASPGTFSLSFTVNGANNGTLVYTTSTTTPVIKFSFSAPVQTSGLNSNFTFLSPSNSAVSFSATLQNNDSFLILQPGSALKGFSKYTLSVSSGLQSAGNASLQNPVNITINTGLDTTDKFPRIA